MLKFHYTVLAAYNFVIGTKPKDDVEIINRMRENFDLLLPFIEKVWGSPESCMTYPLGCVNVRQDLNANASNSC